MQKFKNSNPIIWKSDTTQSSPTGKSFMAAWEKEKLGACVNLLTSPDTHQQDGRSFVTLLPTQWRVMLRRGTWIRKIIYACLSVTGVSACDSQEFLRRLKSPWGHTGRQSLFTWRRTRHTGALKQWSRCRDSWAVAWTFVLLRLWPERLTLSETIISKIFLDTFRCERNLIQGIQKLMNSRLKIKIEKHGFLGANFAMKKGRLWCVW